MKQRLIYFHGLVMFVVAIFVVVSYTILSCIPHITQPQKPAS